MILSHEHIGHNICTLYQQILNAISSPEQNYFVHFAMRYPVNRILLMLRWKNFIWKSTKLDQELLYSEVRDQTHLCRPSFCRYIHP